MIAFSYSNLSRGRPSLTEPWEICLGIEADFLIEVSGREIFSQPYFPVVEFAVDAQIWSSSVRFTQHDFMYTSMEAEQKGLVWIKRAEAGWVVGSAWRKEESSGALNLFEIQAALDSFYFTLRHDVKNTFGIDIEPLFAWMGAKAPRGSHA